MFTVYHSNKMDTLQTIANQLIASNPIRDPFQSEIILVQNTGMAQWMQMKFAAHFGIAANIKFLQPTSFIWQMFTRMIPYIPNESSFTKQAMTWRLMKLLPRLCLQQDFTTISEYLRDDDKRKSFQFATQVAELFDKYMLYRPDWLESWQRGELIVGIGEDQLWQAELWQALMVATEQARKPMWHHANFQQCFIKTLTESQHKPSGLPDRLFICGISALTLTFLQTLQALSHHIDIYLLLINPCRYYWGNIRDRDFLARLLSRHRRHYQQETELSLFCCPKQAKALLNEFGEQQVGNPLLSSWGKQGSDNLYLLAQLDDITEVDAFVEPTGDKLLSLIQRDILALENHAVIGKNSKMIKHSGDKRALQLNDRSLSLHICHSEQREVEVLHDSLLAMMAEDQTLSPRDIMVMVANIEHYTPAIQAVFGDNGNERYLPFIIFDRRTQHLHPVLLAFLSLLELPRSRFTAEQVLLLLEVPALANRFAIDEEKLQLLRKWVTESGIRWGLDDDTLRELMLPATGKNTWQFGLNRMLLGYAMDNESDEWQGILPYCESSGLIAGLVGQLAELLIQLRKWRDRLAQSHSPETWLGYAHEMIEDFFAPDAKAEAALTLLENQWRQILECALQERYDQPVLVTMLQDALTARLEQTLDVNQRFLAVSINFCTFMPMRSIPFRVVCLLGMNDGVYPRTQPKVGFDLMTQQSRCGDRCQRDDDRYMFLEALLSAQEKFYISFIGRAIQDNTTHYPSMLVNELSDYIAQSFYLPGDEHANTESSNNRVRKHLWQWHSRMPFEPDNFMPGSETQSFASEWLPAASGEGNPQPDFIVPLTAESYHVLTLDKLLSFYRHPVRAWFVQRLKVSLHYRPPEISRYEPFVIDSLNRYQLNNKLVNTIINGESTQRLFCQVLAAGLLPYGVFGELYWAKQYKEMQELSEKVIIRQLPKTHSLEIDLMLGNIKLSGCLLKVQNNGLLRWRPGNLSAQDGLLLWLEHLAYCAMGAEGESWMIGTHGEWHFAPLPVYRAKEFLLSLVSGYCRGMVSPLLLLPRSGSAWISYCYDPVTKSINYEEGKQQKANEKLIQAWQGNQHISGEGEDPYLQRLIRQLNKQHIKAITSAAEQYLLTPFMFNLAQIGVAKREKKA
ncbi:exodeoxyribonuclease V subunit gamma [Sodalis endosymbiont of Henestaris halophilus]|uniref:exodeoxyribonuclease V subunit gamma n=1 Tax=Sodalis endosymbiont of Henestaris halophilus TaxID=1929246 RepID=UPI000BC019C7|nr:exodeoxyribonuclease V subunit gamma [Sodalis endosymbiont of Henestaris halophilus]SNC58297.1 RecBCD enzyme subunit RecC [Sodalis endosymbiont of Henestaris halophilus]